MINQPTIDICIVAGRRPDLLADTLSSFKGNLFDNMQIGRVIANIDPIFGDASLDDECRNVILTAYPGAHITLPDWPHFCAAVQRNWMATEAEFVFHLEDDWRMTEKIGPEVLDFFNDQVVAQIILHNWHLDWSVAARGRFSQKACNYRFFGVRVPWKYNRPMYATCPSFFRGSFIRKVASMMDMRFDPDKQMKERKSNPPLIKLVSPFKAYIYGEDDRFPIVDTGRDWRENRGIVKDFADGRSVWRTLE